ncbi:uncharacterized protein LOC120265977 isoform X1 [Dioscorea cayenensis subsp. rotundata]|uniref:Uncharacterized protein LOC120265977 isoform X1 n=1 Tax=Dioscorea cayennensis subsp. rotundata TaxID=55577 RepID=A0AB40BQW6_DIOCR|nr:uncharacterized protein LOC120265977 isoform X1 [Dioscorea cayenensis subsp. rotundata]XP_039129855.1 uncharacterized protein LOC120265977 isoform X1 [Dioscorea cayenensis subsp. rotundata]XP_039129856.1 uncharacterized protein LOC120265977 isoform X1 [Dioscorea cayenensis subsp. rotundata]XP_039129857.1 uncharacterized protein LOC120265977 isoform X1 [Dioscorea cayenensis subsp. rotundata]
MILCEGSSQTFFCLVETKSNKNCIHRLCGTFSKFWDWAAILSIGLFGGIIVLWRRDFGLVTLVANSRSVLHLVISSDNISWILSVVYNSQVFTLQNLICKNLSGISALNTRFLTGDFNAIISDEEHRGGSFRNYISKASLCSSFILKNNLINFGYIGPSFTWCNAHSGLSRRWARLDRYLANPRWISLFKNFSNRHLPRTNYDHSPIFLSIFSFPHSFNKRIFILKNFWFDYAGCNDSVVKAWNSPSLASPMHSFSHFISQTKHNIRRWKAFGVHHLDKKIKNIEVEIQNIEGATSSIDSSWQQTWVQALYNRHSALLRQNSIY